MIENEVVKTQYGNIAVYKKGTGKKAVLLLHGAGCDSAMLSWREVFNIFTEDYSVYAFDFLGYGHSDQADDLTGDRFYDTHIDCVKSVVEHYHLTGFVLAGLSMGGAIAIGYALRCPENIKALIPVDSWGLSEKMPFHRFSYWYVNRTDLTLAQYRWCAKYRWIAKWSISYALIGNKALITDALIDEVMQACAGDTAGRSMLNFQRSSADQYRARPYYLNELKNLEMPVIYIIGEKDPLVPPNDIAKAAKENPNSRVKIFKGCKHWSVKEQPRKFCEIVDFITTDTLQNV
ncbi:MAG: alpha/beta hydrolase [Eubacteriales bacterium]|nr:alpha/beta hydrolase [Eubacteriales bacterium]